MVRFRLFGVFNRSGIGVHASNVASCLLDLVEPRWTVQKINYFDVDDVKQALLTTSENDINIFFFPVDYSKQLRGRKFLWAVFESTRPQPGYDTWASNYDLVLSPSQWGAKQMLLYGIPQEKLRVVPEGVDARLFHPFGRNERTDRRILMVGKYEERKGYDEAFEALDMLYRSGLAFEVAVKADGIGGSKGSAQHPKFLDLCKRYSHVPIVLYSGIASDVEMARLYRSAGFFLFPSKCEGWALPLIEAAACGCNLIATDFGGHNEFLSHLKGLYEPIPYEVRNIDSEDWARSYPRPDGDLGKWAYASPRAIADAVERALGLNDAHYARRRDLVSTIVRGRFSWETSVSTLLTTLLGAQS